MLQLSQLPIDRLSCSSHAKGNQICHPMSPVRWARRSTRRSVLLTDALVHSIHQPKLYPLFLFLPLPLCTVGGTVNGIIYIWHRWQSVCKEKLPILLRVGVDSCLLSLFIQMLWRQISLNLSLCLSLFNFLVLALMTNHLVLLTGCILFESILPHSLLSS